MKFMKRYTGKDFKGDALWGAAPSTWIKFVVPEKFESNVIERKSGPETRSKPRANADVGVRVNLRVIEDRPKPVPSIKPATTETK